MTITEDIDKIINEETEAVNSMITEVLTELSGEEVNADNFNTVYDNLLSEGYEFIHEIKNLEFLSNEHKLLIYKDKELLDVKGLTFNVNINNPDIIVCDSLEIE